MDSLCDILILGAGPAGISAALTAHARGRSVMLLSNDPMESPLAKAPRVDNYPGLTGMSGREMLAAMTAGLGEIPLVRGRAQSILDMGGTFMVSAGTDIYSARSVILATGMTLARAYPGETELLGRGVSYCATCDGMLYRGRKVAVIGLVPGAEEEARFLQSIGCEAEYFDKTRARTYAIRGEDHVTALVADGVEHPVDGVFILRSTVSGEVLLPGLGMENGAVLVDDTMATNIPGVFAAGDCTGKPWQIGRAVGQGNIAALSADGWLNRENKEN